MGGVGRGSVGPQIPGGDGGAEASGICAFPTMTTSTMGIRRLLRFASESGCGLRALRHPTTPLLYLPRQARQAAEEIGDVARRADAALPERRGRSDAQNRLRLVTGAGVRLEERRPRCLGWRRADAPPQGIDAAVWRGTRKRWGAADGADGWRHGRGRIARRYGGPARAGAGWWPHRRHATGPRGRPTGKRWRATG